MIRGAAGTHFAPEVVEAFDRVIRVVPAPAPRERELGAAALLPGMVLAQDLLSPRGALLLAAGYVFDAAVIATIQELVRREGLAIVFRIRDTPANALPLPA